MRYTGPTQYLVLLQDAYFRENRFELVATVKVVLLKFQKFTWIETKTELNWKKIEKKTLLWYPVLFKMQTVRLSWKLVELEVTSTRSCKLDTITEKTIT